MEALKTDLRECDVPSYISNMKYRQILPLTHRNEQISGVSSGKHGEEGNKERTKAACELSPEQNRRKTHVKTYQMRPFSVPYYDTKQVLVYELGWRV